MKKTRQIIIHLFLLGMILSVLQYLPSFQDENSTPGTELLKKAKEDSSDNDDEDDDSSTDPVTDLYFSAVAYYSLYQNSRPDFHNGHLFYKSRVVNVNTPPPKV